MIAKLIYSIIFANLNRGVEQLVARWAHNPKVAGSSPVPATKQDGSVFLLVRFLFPLSLLPVNEWINPNIVLRFEVRYVLSLGSMTIPSGNSNFWTDNLVSYSPDTYILLSFLLNSINLETFLFRFDILKFYFFFDFYGIINQIKN